jgi:glutaconate CoA-transferase subunit B
MFLRGCYAAIMPERVLANMSFAVDVTRAGPVPPPSTEELVILRQRCDPQRLILG